MILFIAINLLVIMAMIFCAYTCMLPPQTYPNWSYFGMAFPVFAVLDIIFIVFWLIFKWKVAALPLLGLLVCAGAARTYFPVNIQREVPGGCIKVLSYNVMSFGKEAAQPFEDNAIVKYIIDSKADIVCIQEGTRSGYDYILSLWEKDYPYQSVQDSVYNFMFLLSKYPILKTERIMYESASNYSYAHTLLVGKDTLYVINNHFESYKLKDEDRENYKTMVKHPRNDSTEVIYSDLTTKIASANAIRGAQADSVGAYIDRLRGKHIIACGDFNDPSISYTHYRMTRYLDDAYTCSGNGPGISYNKSGMWFRIDNILMSPEMESYKAKVDNKISVSDHYPISCYLKICEK